MHIWNGLKNDICIVVCMLTARLPRMITTNKNALPDTQRFEYVRAITNMSRCLKYDAKIVDLSAIYIYISLCTGQNEAQDAVEWRSKSIE